jgi:hypothetical protein
MKTYIIEATVSDIEMTRTYEANTAQQAYDMFISDAIEGGGLEASEVEHYTVCEGTTGDTTLTQLGEDDMMIILNDIERIRNLTETMCYYLEGELILNKEQLKKYAEDLRYISDLALNADNYLYTL